MRTKSLALAIVTTLGLALTACAADEWEKDFTPAEATSGIVGATEATAHPEACVISFDGYICSGTLIAPNVVLTAGHCVAGHSSWSVRCPYSRDTATVTASRGEVPPNYPNLANPSASTIDDNLGSDIGLVRLDRALAETRVGRVRMTGANVGLRVYAMGRIQDGTQTSRMFQSPVFALASKDTRNGYWVAVDRTVIQPGDSGGPLVDQATGEVIGVNSAGVSSCTAGSVCDLWAVLGAATTWFNSTMSTYTGGGTAATPAPTPAPTPTPAPATDACAAFRTCGTCTAQSSCGWCNGACVTGTSSGGATCTSAAGSWAWTSSQCTTSAPPPADACAAFADCGTCTAQAGCGFCNGHCVTGTSSGGATCATTAGTWAWTGNQCPGADPCNTAADCASCTARSSCGWCNGQCFTGTGAGPSTGRCGATPWSWYSSQCR